jgi:hypothetical protein
MLCQDKLGPDRVVDSSLEAERQVVGPPWTQLFGHGMLWSGMPKGVSVTTLPDLLHVARFAVAGPVIDYIVFGRHSAAGGS